PRPDRLRARQQTVLDREHHRPQRGDPRGVPDVRGADEGRAYADGHHRGAGPAGGDAARPGGAHEEDQPRTDRRVAGVAGVADAGGPAQGADGSAGPRFVRLPHGENGAAEVSVPFSLHPPASVDRISTRSPGDSGWSMSVRNSMPSSDSK